jgi:hypothetical protein
MQVGDLVQRSPDVWAIENNDIGVITDIEDEDGIVVVWSCGDRNTDTVYDLAVVCK